MSPDIDALIVSYNARSDLEACLRSLGSLEPSPLARIVLVDNASTDGAADMVRREFPHVDLVSLDRNGGFAAANNIGLARCTSPFVLLLNPDTVVPARAIETLRERLSATGAVAVGPRLVDGEGRPEVSFGPMLSPLGEARQWLRQRLARSQSSLGRWATRRLVARERYVDWVTAACCLVDRQAVVEVGRFDERFFLYEEDVDLCAARRARRGRILFTPTAEVVHARGRSSPGQSGTTLGHYDRSHYLFYEKHRPGWARLLALWKRLRGRAFR